MSGSVPGPNHKNSTVKRAWLSNFEMDDLMRSFTESVRVRTKHVEKIHCDFWGHSTILKAVCDVTSGIKADLSEYDLVQGDEPNGSWWACNTRGWEWSGSKQLIGKNRITIRGILNHASMGVHCLVLPISTKCIFYSVALTIITLQLAWLWWVFVRVNFCVVFQKTCE